jgi:hypothetical protein
MGVNQLPGKLGGPSTEQQQVEQARRNFVNAVLRVESGASINEGNSATPRSNTSRCRGMPQR